MDYTKEERELERQITELRQNNSRLRDRCDDLLKRVEMLESNPIQVLNTDRGYPIHGFSAKDVAMIIKAAKEC